MPTLVPQRTETLWYPRQKGVEHMQDELLQEEEAYEHAQRAISHSGTHYIPVGMSKPYIDLEDDQDEEDEEEEEEEEEEIEMEGEGEGGDEEQEDVDEVDVDLDHDLDQDLDQEDPDQDQDLDLDLDHDVDQNHLIFQDDVPVIDLDDNEFYYASPPDSPMFIPPAASPDYNSEYVPPPPMLSDQEENGDADDDDNCYYSDRFEGRLEVGNEEDDSDQELHMERDLDADIEEAYSNAGDSDDSDVFVDDRLGSRYAQ
ncbi:hypothetical protein EDD11_000991 [Mortierella claussenii]|nr:hypothetical protein EDD11_000991 [Mortierella claussenii]